MIRPPRISATHPSPQVEADSTRLEDERQQPVVVGMVGWLAHIIW